MTADKSSVQMPHNATLMVEELSPNCHSRDFLVVSAPIKDTSCLGHGKLASQCREAIQNGSGTSYNVPLS